MSGVIEDERVVQGSLQEADSALVEQFKRALSSYTLLLRAITVHVHEGAIFLSGTVSSFHFRQIAIAAAQRAVPDLEINDSIIVVRPQPATA